MIYGRCYQCGGALVTGHLCVGNGPLSDENEKKLQEIVKRAYLKSVDETKESIKTMDSSEVYYAEMEYERNKAEDAYFHARPQLQRTIAEETLFKAGFERAFKLLWRPKNERQ